MAVKTSLITKWLATSGLKILLIVTGVILLIRAIYHMIDRMEKMVEDEDPASLYERERRARTLGGILRRASLLTVVAVAIILIEPGAGRRRGHHQRGERLGRNHQPADHNDPRPGGTVHVLPNGTINSLANQSKDWSRYVIDLPLSYSVLYGKP